MFIQLKVLLSVTTWMILEDRITEINQGQKVLDDVTHMWDS